MALERALKEISLPASGDLSTYQYRGVALNSGGSVIISAGSVSPVFGVLQNKPSGAGQAARVAISGITKHLSGGSIAVGDAVKTDAAGLGLVTTTAGNTILGRAVSNEASASGLIYELQIMPSNY